MIRNQTLSKQGLAVTGWLVLFAVAGTIYLFASENRSWLWIPIFAGSLFLVVGLGVLWDWVILRRPVLNARTVILGGVLFWLLLDPLLMREGLEDFSPDIVLKALIYSAIFLVAVWMKAVL